MRILQITLHNGIGGMETLAQGLHDEFLQLGHDADVHALDPGLNDERHMGRISRLQSLRRAIQLFRPDVLISHSALPNLYTRLAANRRWPVITVLHSGSDDYQRLKLRLAEKFLSKRATSTVAVSSGVRDRYVRGFPHMVPTTVVIPNGIPAHIRPRTRRSTNTMRLLAVSRLVPMKRLDLLVASMSRLLQSSSPPDLSLDIVGTGSPEYVQELEHCIARETLNPVVRLLGQRNDVGELLSRYDLLIHPSKWESQGLAILEAAAAGLPVVVSDAVSSSLDSLVVRTTFTGHDPIALENSIRNAIRNLDELQRQAESRSGEIRRKYSMRTCANHYVNLCKAARQGG